MARKRKKKRSIAWERLLVVLTIGNFAVGLLFSPATAATKVAISGGEAADSRFLIQTCQSLKDTPCLRIDPDALEDRTLANQRIKKARLSRNLFGRARLSLTYREPVALVAGSKQVVLADDGRLVDWGTTTKPDTLPVVVSPPAEALRAQVGVGGAWDSRSVARVCELARTTGKDQHTEVIVESTGKVSLNLPGGSRAVLGFPDDLDEKFRRLAELMGTHQRSQNRYEFNLTMPSRPVVKRL